MSRVRETLVRQLETTQTAFEDGTPLPFDGLDVDTAAFCETPATSR